MNNTNREVFIEFSNDGKPPVIVFRSGVVDRTYRITQQRYNRMNPMCLAYREDGELMLFCECEPGAILTPATAGKGE